MSEILKYLGGTLHRVYGAVVQRPMPWRMIDTLVSLEEAEEEARRRETTGGRGTAGPVNDNETFHAQDGPGPPPPLKGIEH
jgi:hypothetical protein